MQRFFFLIICTIFLEACDNPKPDNPNGGDVQHENTAISNAKLLWGTSPFVMDTNRQKALENIQSYADKCPSSYFTNYLNSESEAQINIERYDLMLGYYRAAFDRVLDGLKNTIPANGTAIIYMLYNMGYIIQTPSGVFGIDICHRYAEELAPYLDFLCITHKHSDHYSQALIDAMLGANKPVLSNFVKMNENYVYTSTSTGSTYRIGTFEIYTNLNDHNSTLKDFVTTFQIKCDSQGGNLVLMHVGDSNYKPSQYVIKQAIDVFILRYAPNALTENNVLGYLVFPKYCLLSHALELSHTGVDDSRWSIPLMLERAKKLNSDNAIVPMWGEKLVWNLGKLQSKY